MQNVTKTFVIHSMSADHAPVLTIQPGELVCLETCDCYQEQLLPEGTTFADINRSLCNPATGPVFIAGAAPGDALKITIVNIELDEAGILDIGAGSGALTPFFQEKKTVIRRLPVTDGFIHYSETWKVPVKPMIGVIGTAPAPETGAVGTMSPMDHGGNMDCIKIEEGSILYLPVFAEGGLLSAGDLHAVMGDGEAGNCGVEIGGKITLKVEIEPAKTAYSYPLLENDDQWITIAYGEDLDEAAEKATRQMFELLTTKFMLSETDAGMLIQMAGDLRICQIVNPYKTVRMEIPKHYLYPR